MQASRLWMDRTARRAMLALAVVPSALVVAMVLGLWLRSRPILDATSLGDVLLSSSWRPLSGEFGFYPFIMGTLWVTCIAVALAVPPCILAAIYLSEYAGRALREWAKPLIDLLAGIPSVVFGMCGVLVVVPLIKNRVAPLFGTFSTGYTALAAGIVLAAMIAPVIVHVCLEVFRTVPREARDGALAVGATKWQTVKHVVMRKAMPGVIAASVLGLSRAFGETMAVLMVAGNVARAPSSLLDPAYPLPALIANNYGEMMSIPLYDSALLLAALVLLVVVLVFNVASRAVLVRIERGIAR
ncbi:MAG: phosphate ABC transporter permease subunit PstC [Candidatus Eisenbacteria bacterium]|nr:phosphate ABC transporter permease subunit PstC [Candidatus Eisenbacteria bacterium]